MKIRQGFVSNSSTSSFIIISTKDNFDKTLSESNLYIQAVLNAMKKEEFTIGGVKLMSVGTYSDMGGEGTLSWLEVEYEGEIPKTKYGDEMSHYEAFDEFKEALQNNGETFSTDLGNG